MRVQIIKSLPAPLLDGFDVRGFQGGNTYEVDDRRGGYLIVAGYGVRVDAEEQEGEQARTR